MRETLLVLCLLIGGCDTMTGLGMDMERAGANLSAKATEAKFRNQYPPPQQDVTVYPPNVAYEGAEQ